MSLKMSNNVPQEVNYTRYKRKQSCRKKSAKKKTKIVLCKFMSLNHRKTQKTGRYQHERLSMKILEATGHYTKSIGKRFYFNEYSANKGGTISKMLKK